MPASLSLSSLVPRFSRRQPCTGYERNFGRGRELLAWQVRVFIAAMLAVLCVSLASAVDEVVLKNGRRYLGTIVATTATTVVLAIDGGTVEFPRAIVASPPHLATSEAAPESVSKGAAPDAASLEKPAEAHPLPELAEALQRLREFSWVSGIRQVPVLVTDQGRWQFLPAVSFWAADFFQLTFYGDPERPSAIEVSLHHPAPTAWEQKRHLLEYMLSLAPGLAADNRFDRLNLNGDQFTIGDLWFEVTAPDNAKTPGRWVVLLLHELSLNTARASYDDLQVISELLPAATIDTSQPRSWQRGSWLPEELNWMREAPGTATIEAQNPGGTARSMAFMALGGERVFVRAYARQRGKYARASNDWEREFVAAAR